MQQTQRRATLILNPAPHSRALAAPQAFQRHAALRFLAGGPTMVHLCAGNVLHSGSLIGFA